MLWGAPNKTQHPTFRTGKLALLNRTIVVAGTPDQLRDEKLWMDTFGIGEHNPLLKLLKVT